MIKEWFLAAFDRPQEQTIRILHALHVIRIQEYYIDRHPLCDNVRGAYYKVRGFAFLQTPIWDLLDLVITEEGQARERRWDWEEGIDQAS